MPFDPDAYLGVKSSPKAGSSGFDPDAYLGEDAPMSAGAESNAKSIKPLGKLDEPKKGPEVSQMGTFNRALAEGAGTIPTMLYGIGAGAELGAKTKVPYAAPVGGLVGGIIGGMLGHLGITSLEQVSDSVFGTKIMETKAAQDKAFPWTSKIGNVAGTLVGPGMAVGLPRTVAEAAIGGTIMGGVGAGMRAIEGQDVLSPGDIALDVGSGMLGRPTALGEKMIGTGRTAVDKIGQAFSKKPEAPKTDSSPEPTVSDAERKSFLERVKDKSPLTETAFRDKDGNILKTGPKHPDELRADPDFEPGFVDPTGKFYTRAEADAQARKSGQIPKDYVLETPTDGQVGLHSNDLRKVGDERFKVEEKPPTTSNNKAPVTREEHKDRIEIIEDDMYYLDIDEAIESTSLKKASNEYDQSLKETIELAKLPQDENTRAKKKELDEKRTQLLEQKNEANLRIQELKAKIDQYTLERDKLRENLPKPKIDNLENPAWEEVHDIIYKAKTVGEALKKIEESGIGTRSQKWFAKLLATSNLVNEASLQLRKDVIPYRTDDGKTGSARGLYHPDNHRVDIGYRGDFETVLHEATHAAVWHLMHDNQSALAQKMNTLYEMHKASASPEARAEYGYDNVHEFVSEAMNNDDFKAHLKTTKSTEAFETKTTNLWDKFKQIVHEEIIAKLRRDAKTEEQHAEVEALKNNTKTALDEVMDIASGLIEESKNMKFDRTKKVPVDGAEPNKPAASREIKETGSDQDVLDGKAKKTSVVGFDKEGLLEDIRLRDKHTEVIKSMGRRDGGGYPTTAEINMLSKVADSITKQRNAHADKYKEHSLGKLVKDAQNAMKPTLVSSEKEVTKLDSKRKDLFEDPDTKKAWEKVDVEMSQPVADRFSTISRDEAQREIYKKYLTKADILEAARKVDETEGSFNKQMAGKEHINKVLDERSEGKWLQEWDALRKKGPTEMERAEEYYGETSPDNRSVGEKAFDTMRANKERLEFSRKTDTELRKMAENEADGEVYQAGFEAHQEGATLNKVQEDSIRKHYTEYHFEKLRAKRDAAEGSGPVAASKILPEEVKKAAKGIDVRSISSEAAFMKHAEDIYAAQGEAAALKFFEDWKKYTGTWKEPVKEVEKFVSINLNTKMANERIIHNEARKMTELVPKNIREEVARAIDKGEADKLTGPAKELAERYQVAMKDIGERAVKEGVVNGLLENYVTHIVNWSDMPKGALEELLGELFGKKGAGLGGMTPESRFGKERKVDTFENLEKTLGWINDKISAAGKDFKLEIKTTDVAEIYKEYALSMEKAIENKKLIDSVKGIRNAAGESLVRRVTEEDPMPRGWEMIQDRQFAGYTVHPDLAPALKFAFETRGNKAIDAIYTVSQGVKRLNVIGSFFHAKSLMEVLSSAHVPLWTPVKEVTLGIADKILGTKMSGITQAVARFKEGGLGDSTDKWIKSGLVLEVPEDVTKGLLASAGKFGDSMIGKYGPKTRVLETSLSFVEKNTLGIFDKITWDFLHTGGKLYTADKYLEKQRLDAMKSGKEFNEDLARAEITQFINRSFGGLNWFQEASKANTEFGKRMSMAAYSPQGRKNLQIVLFAPDWTISTIKAFTSALPEKLSPKDWHPIEGIKGMVNPTTKADYARLYQFKTALLYFTLLNAINMVTANRPIWENKDPTRIEFQDGTSMQAMKHAMEPYHWLSDPASTLTNKLGFVPKAAITGLTGLEYASPYAPKLVDPSLANRAGVIAKSALPFQISAAVNAPEGEGMSRAISGTMGFPIYGKTAAEKKLARSTRAKEQKEFIKKYKDKARERGWE